MFSTNFIQKINNKLKGDIEVFSQLRQEPKVIIDPGKEGEYYLESDILSKIDDMKIKLILSKRPNDPHAILKIGTNWDASQITLEGQTLDFAAVKVLRGPDPLNPKPLPVISSNILIISPEEKVVLLNRRGRNIDTYPGSLHTFGGAYMPPMDFRENDRDSVHWTAMREVFEESGVIVTWENANMMIMEEKMTGFIQVAYLGLPVSAAQCASLRHGWEGRPESIPFTGLHEELKKQLQPVSADGRQWPYWVPTGKAAVLAWLALGAPGADPRDFPKSPIEIFEDLVR